MKRSDSRISLVLFLALMTILSTGCTYYVQEPIESVAVTPQTRTIATAQLSSRENMYTDITNKSQNASMGSLELDERFNNALKRSADLEKQVLDLKEENIKLAAKLETATSDLERANNDLVEADKFMRNMDKDLAQWKAEITNDRKENKIVQKAQLEALTRILRSLGAEEIENNEQ